MNKFEKVPEGVFNKVEHNKQEFINKFIDDLEGLFPETVKDGIVDFQALLDRFGEYEESNKIEKYNMTWVGKRQAIKEADKDIVGRTLKYVEEDSKNPETTENIYIEGDNLEVLKLLRQSYYGKIKMIYIDPPYNTGNDFVYRDDFTITEEEYAKLSGELDEYGERLVKNSKDSGRYHSKWLNMMYPRLKVARDLLTDDGVIFISIDDNEVHNMRKICDEIFGEKNFIGNISVENNPKGRKNSDFISVSSEYCLIYSKNKSKSYFIENIPKRSTDMKKDEDGIYVHNSGKRVLVGNNSFNKFVENKNSSKHYSVYYNKEKDDVIIKKENDVEKVDEELISSNYYRYISERDNRFIENTYTVEKFLGLYRNKALEFKEDKIFEKNLKETIRMKSLLTNDKYKAIIDQSIVDYAIDLKTTSGKNEVKSLFNVDEEIFSAPKTVCLLKLLISLIEDKDSIILDFFSGSATTAHAVMDLNAEDGGNRKYIMVQLPEPTDEKSEAYKAGYKNICEIGKERIRRAGDMIVEENKDKKGIEDLDIGFKVFKVEDTNLKLVKDTVKEGISMEEHKAISSKDSKDFNPHFTDIDVVYEMMLKRQDIDLNEEIILLDDIGERTYLVGYTMLICLEEEVTEEMVEKIGSLDVDLSWIIMRDSAFGNNINLKLNTVNKLRTIVKENHRKEQKIYWI